MGFTQGSEFGGPRTNVQTTISAVIADSVAGAGSVGSAIVDDGAVVDVGDVANVGDGAVVVEVMPVPVAAEVADADIAEAVVDASVEADVRTPITVMEGVAASVVAPVGRRPKSTVVGWGAPYAGNPVVAVCTPGPVTGRPKVVWIGCGWLIVFRKWRRGLGRVVILCVSATFVRRRSVVGVVLVAAASILLVGVLLIDRCGLLIVGLA